MKKILTIIFLFLLFFSAKSALAEDLGCLFCYGDMSCTVIWGCEHRCYPSTQFNVCSATECQGPGGDRCAGAPPPTNINSITAPSININPNNARNNDKFDVNFSGITYTANDPPSTGSNCSETISVLIGPDNNIPADRTTTDPFTANSCDYINSSCTSSSLSNSGARNSNGWNYQGGQICAKARLRWTGNNCVGKNAFSNVVCWNCSNINSTATPVSVLPGEQITFNFSSDYPFDNIQERFNSGNGVSSCTFSSSGNSWTWTCRAITPGNYTATFDNRQNCQKTVSYTVRALPATPTIPANACDSVANRLEICYNSTRPDGACQNANLYIKTNTLNNSTVRNSLRYEVKDSLNTLIDGDGPWLLNPQENRAVYHTLYPPVNGIYPQNGVRYCGALTMTTFCNSVLDINPANNTKTISTVPPCSSILTPTPTPVSITPTRPPNISSSWFQGAGGNIHAGTTLVNPPIFSNIPANALIPYFLINRDQNPNSTGIVSIASSVNPNLGAGTLIQNNSRNWLLKNYIYGFSGENEFDYSYFSTTLTKSVKMEKSNQYTLSGSQITGTAPNDSADLTRGNVWDLINGDLIISGNLSSSLGTQIILVKGRIIIETNIEKTTNTFPVFISNGPIKIDPSVQKLNGVFITSDIFETGSNITTSDNQLILENGMAISYNRFSLDRNLTNKTIPAEKFIFDPEYIIKLSQILGRSKNRWQEVNP